MGDMTSKPNLAMVNVTSGKLYEHLNDVQLFGRIDEKNDFIIYGCQDKDQTEFYNGILEYDKATNIQGFQSVEEVKEYWEEMGDMFLTLELGQYEIVKLLNRELRSSDE